MRVSILAAAMGFFGIASGALAAPTTEDFDSLGLGVLAVQPDFSIAAETAFGDPLDPAIVPAGADVAARSGDQVLALRFFGADDFFLAGDIITFNFTSAITSFEIFAITVQNAPLSFEISAGLVSDAISTPVGQLTLPDDTPVDLFQIALSGFEGDDVTITTTGFGAFSFDDLSYEFVGPPIPVPGAVWLFAAGAAGFAGLKRRSVRWEA